MSLERNFLGRGWSFPPAFNVSIKGVEMLENENDIKSSLEILLSTATGQRIMLPQYGCDLHELLFEPLNATLETFMTDKIKTAILLYEPRIDVKQIELKADRIYEGIVLINIEYVIRSTNSRYNMVFPFYKIEATEIHNDR